MKADKTKKHGGYLSYRVWIWEAHAWVVDLDNRNGRYQQNIPDPSRSILPHKGNVQ